MACPEAHFIFFKGHIYCAGIEASSGGQKASKASMHWPHPVGAASGTEKRGSGKTWNVFTL